MDSKKRDKILKAAIKVFARDGFFNAKMEEIASTAGVATGTPYLYFKNKDDLLISIFEEEMVPIIENMRKKLSELNSAREKLTGFVNFHMDMVQKKPDMAQLLQVELRQSNKFVHGYSGTKFKEYLAIISDILVQGQEEGEFRTDINPTIFKQILFGAIDEIATNWTLSKTKKIKLTDSADQISKVILEGLEVK